MQRLVQPKTWQTKWECLKQISIRDWKLLHKHSEKQWKVAQDLVKHLGLQWKLQMELQIPVLIWDLLLHLPQQVTWRM